MRVSGERGRGKQFPTVEGNLPCRVATIVMSYSVFPKGVEEGGRDGSRDGGSVKVVVCHEIYPHGNR